MSVYELQIDGSSAESGAQKIVKSFESILAASNRMEGGVSAAAKRMVSSFRDISNVRTVSREAISQLTSLSSALGSFKGPSKTAVENTSRFLAFLRTVGRMDLPSGARMASFLAAMSGYRGPSAAAGRNTQSVLRALSGFSAPAGIGGRVTAFLAALASYRGPSANAGKNTISLFRALASFSGAPPNLRGAVTAFAELANVIDRAARSMGSLRRANSSPLRAPITSSFVGIEKNFNPRRFAGDLDLMRNSILRTTTALNTLGGILAARAIIFAANDIIKITAQLEAATGTVEQARVQFSYLRDISETLGLEFRSAARSYGFFLGAIKGVNITVEEARQIFQGFATAGRALQLSIADMDGVFRALGQIMSKGKLQAEELRGQLGDRLPGAFVRFARALDMTKPGELDDALKKGAISGDKLKKAIIEVATTMEAEFSVSADKASKTVDAAFNRLQNSFTFAADALGKGGMNEAIVNLTDALRKILASEGLNKVLTGLGAAFKFVGDNAETFGAIVGSVAVGALIKFSLHALTLGKGLAGLATAFTILKMVTIDFAKVQAAVAVANFAKALSGATVATTALTRAQILLNTVTKGNIFGIIAAAVATLVFAYTQLSKKTDEHAKKLKEAGQNSGTAANGVAAFTAQLADNTAELDTNTQAIRNNIAANLTLLQQAYGQSGVALTTGKVVGRKLKPGETTAQMVNGPNGNRYAVSTLLYNSEGQVVGGGGMSDALSKLGTISGGQFTPRRINNAADYREFYKAQSQLGAYIPTLREGSPEREFAQSRFDIASGYFATFDQAKNAGIRLNFDPQTERNKVFKDPDGLVQTPGLSGDAADKPDKSGEAAIRRYEQDIRRAQEALRDLRRETSASRKEMEAYFGSFGDVMKTQAEAAAEAKVNNFMDSFANVAEAEKGIVDLNKRLHAQKDVMESLSPAARKARKDVIDLMAAEELAASEAKRSAEAAKNIQDLRIENDLQKDLVAATSAGGAALEEANREAEIRRQLVGVAGEDEERLTIELRKQLELRDAANRALKIAQTINDERLAAQNRSDTSTLYTSGYTPAEIDYYKELIELRNKLVNDGFSNEEVNFQVRLRQAALDNIDVYNQLIKKSQEIRQMSQDQADAIVDGFKQGIESGQSFLKTMKNIMNSLKDIFLDFVLYNPLREFLADTFTASNGRTFQSAADASTTKAGAFDIRSMVFDAVGLGGSSSGGSGGIIQQAVSAAPPSQQALSTIGEGISTGMSDSDNQDPIVITGTLNRNTQALEDIQKKTSGPQYFQKLGEIFNGKGFDKISKVFTGGMDKLGENLQGALGAAGQAFAAYSIGKGIAKSLGLGRVGGEVMGGAAAGFSLGGPVGAGIGAALGLAKGLLFKPKVPSAFANVEVGENGKAVMGASGKKGKGNLSAAQGLAGTGSSVFNTFADEFDLNLTPGKYGTFGQYKDKQYYSVTGLTSRKKKKPLGREGVDFIYGTESELQGFALRTQLRSGKITGLTPSQQIVAKNTTANTVEGIQNDFNVAKAFDEFIKGSFRTSDVKKQVDELNEAYKKLARQSKALGLSETKLAQARDRMLKVMREDFNFNVSQGILGIEDPIMAAYNALVKEYRDTVQDAMAVGGDLEAVEKFYGLRRVELLKQYSENATSAIKNAADNLLTQLTASSSSPLANSTILRTSQGMFRGLKDEIAGGNFSNVDQVQEYAKNYLDAARTQFSSSTAYFDIFNEVVDFLSMLSTNPPDAIGGTNPDDLPELPTLDALVAEITAANKEMADIIGSAVVETGAETNEHLSNISNILTGIRENTGGLPGSGLASVVGGAAGSAFGISGGGLKVIDLGLPMNF